MYRKCFALRNAMCRTDLDRKRTGDAQRFAAKVCLYGGEMQCGMLRKGSGSMKTTENIASGKKHKLNGVIVKKRAFEIIQIGNRTDIPSLCFDVFIVFVILLNISVTFLQTFDRLGEVPSGAVAFRMLRVVGILRLFKINSRYDAFNVITEVIRDKKNALVSSIFMVLVLMLEKGGGPPKRVFSS